MASVNEGYIYCFSNPSMPGILKVGMTERTPEERAKELFTTGVPLPYKIEFAKKVTNIVEKEKTIHILLEQYTDRIHPRREFFRVSPEEVYKFFDLMDGVMWVETREEEEEEEEDTYPESAPRVKGRQRDMKKYFINGQRIRHTIGISKTWVGVYDSIQNGIIYDGQIYTLNKFASNHYKEEKPNRSPAVNAWRECECEVDGKWISTYTLPESM